MPSGICGYATQRRTPVVNMVCAIVGEILTPQRLMDALRHIFKRKNSTVSEYSYIGNESGYSSASDLTRSRGESSASEESINTNAPLLPVSPPPPPRPSLSSIEPLISRQASCWLRILQFLKILVLLSS